MEHHVQRVGLVAQHNVGLRAPVGGRRRRRHVAQAARGVAVAVGHAQRGFEKVAAVLGGVGLVAASGQGRFGRGAPRRRFAAPGRCGPSRCAASFARRQRPWRRQAPAARPIYKYAYVESLGFRRKGSASKHETCISRGEYSTWRADIPLRQGGMAVRLCSTTPCDDSVFSEAGCPPRRDAIHRVSHVPDGLGGAPFLPPTARGKAPPGHSFSAEARPAVWAPGKAPLLRSLPAQVKRNVVAGLRPERVRRDESRLYVADFPCNGDDGRETPCTPLFTTNIMVFLER